MKIVIQNTIVVVVYLDCWLDWNDDLQPHSLDPFLAAMVVLRVGYDRVVPCGVWTSCYSFSVVRPMWPSDHSRGLRESERIPSDWQVRKEGVSRAIKGWMCWRQGTVVFGVHIFCCVFWVLWFLMFDINSKMNEWMHSIPTYPLNQGSFMCLRVWHASSLLKSWSGGVLARVLILIVY